MGMHSGQAGKRGAVLMPLDDSGANYGAGSDNHLRWRQSSRVAGVVPPVGAQATAKKEDRQNGAGWATAILVDSVKMAATKAVGILWPIDH